MNWLNIDRNGVVDGVDFYILHEILGRDEERDTDESPFPDRDEDDSPE